MHTLNLPQPAEIFSHCGKMHFSCRLGRPFAGFIVPIFLTPFVARVCAMKRGRCELSASLSTVQVAKSGIPLDARLPLQYSQTYHVLKEGEEIWDAKLNLANSNQNNNKFYVMQLLEPDSGKGDYLVWTRWGRVGKQAAKHQFEEKFRSKTTGPWSDRDTLSRDPKKYYYLKMDYLPVDETEAKGELAPSKPRPQCKLHPSLQNLVKLVCNVDEMARQMTEIGYDTKKLPLGKLSESTIKHGQTLLQRLSDVISGKQEGSVTDLSDEFYTVIPHNFGFQKLSAFTIRTADDVKKKMEMLDSLSEVAYATRLLSDVQESATDVVTASYDKLSCKLEHLPEDDDVHQLIKRYLESTVGHTAGHTHYALEVEDIFAVERAGEEERFRKGRGSQLKNHMLLWHGSRLSNWVGILSKGLLIAPPEAPSTGYMFGKGIYFADMVTKSTGVLMLSEVALGETNDLVHADYDAGRKLSPSQGATKGVGITYPSKSEPLPDGSCMVPLGPCVKSKRKDLGLQYNEYIVYNLDQVRMRYLVRVRFNFK